MGVWGWWGRSCLLPPEDLPSLWKAVLRAWGLMAQKLGWPGVGLMQEQLFLINLVGKLPHRNCCVSVVPLTNRISFSGCWEGRAGMNSLCACFIGSSLISNAIECHFPFSFFIPTAHWPNIFSVLSPKTLRPFQGRHCCVSLHDCATQRLGQNFLSLLLGT